MITSSLSDRIALDYLSTGLSLNAIRNKEEIRKWCRQIGLIDDTQQDAWHKKISSDPTIRMYAIKDIEASNNRIVGVCGLTDIDHVNQRAEFSCYIFPDQHRKGYASEALLVLFQHGFNDLNLNMIWGETFEDNPAYYLFKYKLHMTEEGIRRNFYFKNGRFINAYLLSISRKEFYEFFMGDIDYNPYSSSYDFDLTSFE
jgi:RimJ/RimL family protein N-acetyltransferase